jgi:thiol-disulfide isomerase/thioredoxin
LTRPGGVPSRSGLIGPFTGRQIAITLAAVAIVAVGLVIVSSPVAPAPTPLPSVGNGFVMVGPATTDLQVGQRAPELSGLVPTDTPSRTVPLALLASGALTALLGLGLVRRSRVALIAVVGGLVVALVGVPLLLAPGPAPRTAGLVDLKGNPITLAQFAGHPMWIDFFATWCPPCQQETPTLEAVYREHQAEGLILLAISVQETSAADVQAYATQYGLTYPIGFDATSAVFKAYRAFGLPTQVFIDRQGLVRSVVRGPLDQTSAEQQLAPILSRSGGQSPATPLPSGSAGP